MARLPDPQLEEIEIVWDEGYKEKEDTFFKRIGQAIRNAEAREKKRRKAKINFSQKGKLDFLH